NSVLPLPIRRWTKNTGPGDSNLIARTIAIMRGRVTLTRTRPRARSTQRLNARHPEEEASLDSGEAVHSDSAEPFSEPALVRPICSRGRRVPSGPDSTSMWDSIPGRASGADRHLL